MDCSAVFMGMLDIKYRHTVVVVHTLLNHYTCVLSICMYVYPTRISTLLLNTMPKVSNDLANIILS